MTTASGQNSTKNLANLSRLFRQLRPHLIQSISSHVKSTKKQIETSGREGGGDDGCGLLQNPTRVPAKVLAAVKSDTHVPAPSVLGLPEPPLQVGGALRSTGPTHSQTILMKHLNNQLTAKRSEATRSREQLPLSEKVSPSHSQIADLCKKDTTSQKSRTSKHDRKTSVNAQLSSSLLGSSSKGSPLTSSWESFTRPVKLTERHRELEEEGEGEGQGSQETGRSERMDRHHLLPVPGQRSRGHSDEGSPSGPEIETHKLRIARAVDNIREKRQHQNNQQNATQRPQGGAKAKIVLKEVNNYMQGFSHMCDWQQCSLKQSVPIMAWPAWLTNLVVHVIS